MPHREREDDQRPDQTLTERELEAIADRVFEKMMARIGQSSMKFLVWIAGLAIIGVLVYLGIVDRAHASAIAFKAHTHTR